MAESKPNFNSVLLTIVLGLCAMMIAMGGYGLKKTAENSETLAGMKISVDGLTSSAVSMNTDVRALQHDMMPRAEIQSQILSVKSDLLRLSSELVELRSKQSVMEVSIARMRPGP